MRLGAEGFATCVCVWRVPRGVEDRDKVAMLDILPCGCGAIDKAVDR